MFNYLSIYFINNISWISQSLSQLFQQYLVFIIFILLIPLFLYWSISLLKVVLYIFYHYKLTKMQIQNKIRITKWFFLARLSGFYFVNYDFVYFLWYVWLLRSLLSGWYDVYIYDVVCQTFSGQCDHSDGHMS